MKTKKFYEDLEAVMVKQYERYEFYRNMCHKNNIYKEDINKIIRNNELYRLPPIFTLFFKKSKNLMQELNDLSKPNGSFMISSSTYGDPSYIYCSENDLNYVRNEYGDGVHMENTSNLLAFCPPTDILYKAGKTKSLFDKYTLLRMTTVYEGTAWRYKMIDMVKTDIIKLVNKAFNRTSTDNNPFCSIGPKNFSKVIVENYKKNQNTILAGISLLIYPIVTEYFKAGEFSKGEKIFIVTAGGGWQGKKGKITTAELKKADFVTALAERFGISEQDYGTRFKDLYSFCESPPIHEGYWHNDFKNFVYEPSPETVVYALNPETKKVVGAGATGVFQVITPYGCEYSANSNILQGDLVEVLETNDDGSVKRFTNIKRYPGLEIEGCAYETRGLVGEIKK